MTVIGAAEVVITPVSAGFESKLASQTNPAFGRLSKDAEKAGHESGGKLSSGFSKGVGGIGSVLAGIGLPMGTFGGQLHKTAEGMAEVEHKGKGLSATMATLGGRTLLGATAEILGVGAVSVEAAKKYQDSTVTIAANANIGVEAAKRIGDEFLKTAGHTIYSAQQIGVAYGQVAGVLGELQGRTLTGAEAMKVMQAAMNLAEGAGISLDSAATNIVKTMQAYHLGVGDSSKATDVLFTTSRVTGIGIDQLTTSLTRAKGKLGELGPSLGESASLIATLAKHGSAGRIAIGQLNTAFSTLVGGGKDTTKMAEQLGIHIFDSNNKFVGMKSIIAQLSPVLARYNNHSQEMIAKTFFGKAATQQLLGVVREGPDAFGKTTAAVSRSGAAQTAAEKQAKTFQHQFDLAKAAAIDMAIKIGNFLIPKLAALASKISEGIDWLGKHKEAAKALAIVITTILGAAVAVFVEQKMVAFGRGIGRMIGDMGKLVSGIKAGVARIIASFTAESVAADATATNIVASSATVDASFTTTAATAWTATGSVTGAVRAEAAVVAEADASIVTANEAAGASFTAMLGPIGLAVAAAYGMKEVSDALGITNPGKEGFAQFGKNLTNQGLQKSLEGAVGRSGSGGGRGAEISESEGKSHTQGGIMGFFMAKGLTAAQAAGIVGNIEQESGTNPKAAGGGLFQGIGSRAGLGQGSVKQQIERAWQELQGPQHKALEELRKTHTPEEAAHVFSGSAASGKGFERPGTPAFANREKYAREAFQAHPQGTSQHTTAVQHNTKALEHLTGNLALPAEEHSKHKAAGIGSHKSAAGEGYVDPFAHATGLTRSRTDQGVDFSFGGSFGAIGSGVIEAVKHFRGFRETIIERLTSGSHKGQRIYYGLETGAVGSVHGGQHVKAGQRLGYGRGSGGVEFGFAGPDGLPIQRYGPGQSHGQPLAGGEAFSKFLAQVGKGGSALQLASKVFETVAKAELKKQAADAKVGNTTLNRMVSAIHAGGVKELSAVVGGKHDAELKKLETTLHKDHTSALEQLVKKLQDTHKKALAALQIALVKAAEKATAEREKREDTLNTDRANAIVQAIANQTKITLDRAAEAGKEGTALFAAQAQTALDAVKAADEAAIAAAKFNADAAVGSGELAEANAQQALVNTENQAKINEANAQAALDLANNAASEAEKAANKSQELASKAEAERREQEAKETQTPAVPLGHTYNFTIYGPDFSAQQLMQEVGWALKTGALPPPPAPATPVHA